MSSRRSVACIDNLRSSSESCAAPLDQNSNAAVNTMVDMIRDCNWVSSDGPSITDCQTSSMHEFDMRCDESASQCYSASRMDVISCSEVNSSAKEVFTQFDALRRNNELCDVDILVGDRKFPAHRVVLAAHSPYFHAMFTRELNECRQREVRIHEVDETAMDTLVTYCYTSCLMVNESNVQHLLPAACLFQMADVQRQCCDFLKKQIDVANCLEIRAFADTHSCDDLLRFADQYAQDNFNQITRTDEFLEMSRRQLLDMISSNDLCVVSEEDVFDGVMRWIGYKPASRVLHLSELLGHVRLALMKPQFLVHNVGENEFVKRSHSCRDLVDRAKNYLLLPLKRDAFEDICCTPRKPCNKKEWAVFVVGGWCTGDAISTVEAYDSSANQWRLMERMNKSRCGVGVGVVKNMIYAVGGHDGIYYLNTVERYDALTNIWSMDVAPTSSCRTSVGVAVLDEMLYAVGGQDGVSCLNIVERYDPNVNRWMRISGLNNRRLGAAVTVSTGDDRGVYAIGGSDGVKPLGTVEFFDPRVGRWILRSAMTVRRKHLGAAAFRDHIYAVGGRDHASELSSAERYSPRMDLWTPVVHMNTKRSGVSLAVLNNSLMAIGGFDGFNYLNSIEVLGQQNEVLNREWKLGAPMNHRRLGSGVGVLCYRTSDLSRSMTFN